MTKITKPDYGTLYFLYIKKNYSQKALAKNFKVSQSTVCRWLKSYEITKTKKWSFWSFVKQFFLKIIGK